MIHKHLGVTMTTTAGQTGAGAGRPQQQLSGLIEDRLAPAPTQRQRVDEAAATLIALLSKLEEHAAEDEKPEHTATSNRLFKLQTLLGEHLSA